MGELTIRAAREGDQDRIAAIIDDPPNRATVAIAGDERRARAVGRLFARMGLSVQLSSTVVAEIDGEAIGIMDAGIDRKDPDVTPLMAARMLGPALRAVGPRGLRRYLRSRPAWGRVGFSPLPTDYFIAELDVAASHRNRGIGAWRTRRQRRSGWAARACR